MVARTRPGFFHLCLHLATLKTKFLPFFLNFLSFKDSRILVTLSGDHLARGRDALLSAIDGAHLLLGVAFTGDRATRYCLLDSSQVLVG